MTRKIINQISRRKLLKTTSVALLPTGVVSPAGAKETDHPDISAKRATKMAQLKRKQIEERKDFNAFKRGKVADRELYYAITEDGDYYPTAWVFSVKADQNTVGHMTVGADSSQPGVLEWGTSKPPHDQIPDAAYYINQSPLSFGVVETSNDDEYIDFMTGSSIPIEHATSDYTLDNENRFESAGQVIEQQSKEPSSMGSGEVNGYVPNWNGNDIGNDWPGCSPLAAGMAIGYHEDTNYGDRENLVLTLADKMNTGTINGKEGMTWPWNIDGGIEKYDGENNYSAQNCYYGRPNAAKSGVNNNNPPIVSTLGDKESGKSSTQDVKATGWDAPVGHTETITGYEEDNELIGTNLYLKTNTGWGNTRELLVGDYFDTYMITTISP